MLAQRAVRKQLLERKQALWQERLSWMDHWQDIANHLLPRTGRFLGDEANRGERRNKNIFDATATLALNTMVAGIMAHATSPARQWFRQAPPFARLRGDHSAERYLADVDEMIRSVLAKSGYYQALHSVYEEMGAFGTGALLGLPDDKTVVAWHPLTVGEYAIGADSQRRVNTLYREYSMTVGQMWERWPTTCSKQVAEMAKKGQVDAWRKIVHAIEPRPVYDPRRQDALDMPFRSVWFEAEGSEHDGVLQESGYRHFPALVPRWKVRGTNIYGDGPGMDALGFVRGLQTRALYFGKGVALQVIPPMAAGAGFKESDLDLVPGGLTFNDDPNDKVTPIYQPNVRLDHLTADILDVRRQVEKVFHADLFLLLSNAVGSVKTAYEAGILQEEKLLMLGPVATQIETELLRPTIELVYSYLEDAGLLPEPPESLAGVESDIEFLGVLAQAQRAVKTHAQDRFLAQALQLSERLPDVLDRLDADAIIEEYASGYGVPPKILVDKLKAVELRKARAQAMAAKEQAALMAQGAGVARDLATAPAGGGSVLDGLGQLDPIGMFSGYGGAG